MSEFQDGIGHADDLERLWTPYRMAYIRGENKPTDGSGGSVRSAGSRASTTRPGWSCGAARRRTSC